MLVQWHHTIQIAGIGDESQGDEYPGNLQYRFFPAFHITQLKAPHDFFTFNRLDHRVPSELNFRFIKGPFL